MDGRDAFLRRRPNRAASSMRADQQRRQRRTRCQRRRLGSISSEPLSLESLSKPVHAAVMTAAEAHATSTAARLLVSGASSQGCESHEIDRELVVIHAEQRCEIFAESSHAVLQLPERQNAMPFEVRVAVQRRNDALLDVGKQWFAVDNS